MRPLVINIPSQYEVILPFLFPDYSVYLSESPALMDHFITHRDVKSSNERELINIQYSDCVFISTQIFDELWDEDTIAKYIVKRAHSLFKDRRTKFVKQTKDVTGVATWTKETFVEDCLNYLLGLPTASEDSTMLELFDTYGSKTFADKYAALVLTQPYQKVFAGMLTFISKINKDTTSVYYKRKYNQLGQKLAKNKMQAITEYSYRPSDGFGFSELKLLMDLIS